MKCISCGKNFDEEKYYRICPKCGTYNNVKKTTPDFSQGSRQTGGSCGNSRDHGPEGLGGLWKYLLSQA